jgi:hypothetical protein
MRMLTVLAIACLLPAQDPRRHASGDDRGLVHDAGAFRPYHEDPAHPLNRVFRTVWLRRMVPAEVGAVVPREPAFEWREGWVHKKRPGGAGDERWFGGDGRLLPLEVLAAAEAEDLRGALAAIDEPALGALRDQPELVVLFQHDLLRAAERLLETKQNAALVPVLLAAARRVALDSEALAKLRDPLARALGDGGVRAVLAAELPVAVGGTSDAFREVLRRSTRVFDAEKTLLWSRVFLAHPDGAGALQAMLAPPDADAKAPAPTVPIGFRAVLVQGVVAMDRDGKPRATPLVFDVRTQVLRNRDPLSAGNPTFTHDGIDFGIWQLERQGLRRGALAELFRRIDADDQDLFRDYGTAKHTTYRGQCTLCHRVSGTPEPELAGFPVLRPHAKAAFAATGDERLRLAETQAAKLFERLGTAR